MLAKKNLLARSGAVRLPGPNATPSLSMQTHAWPILLLAALGVLCGLSPAAADPLEAADRIALRTEQGIRHCYVHLPPQYSWEAKQPLVLVLHGGGGTARAAVEEGGWIEKADTEGFLLAVPNGTRRHHDKPAKFVGNPQSWNDGSARTGLAAVEQGIDDVAFLAQLLDELSRRYAIDPDRVYATGFSNGASMSFRLARELPERFAAIAPVAGVDWLTEPKPSRPVPILYITGTADPLNPYQGGEVRIGRRFYGVKPPTMQMMKTWAAYHQCQPDPVETQGPANSRQTRYLRADGRNPVTLLVLLGHGHHWPGGNSKLPQWLSGKNQTQLNATDTIWEFFKTRSRPAEAPPPETQAAE